MQITEFVDNKLSFYFFYRTLLKLLYFLKFAKISVFLNEANEELQASVAKKDFAKAGILQEQIDEAKSKKDDLEKQLNPTIPETDVTISLEKVIFLKKFKFKL